MLMQFTAAQDKKVTVEKLCAIYVEKKTETGLGH